MTRPLTMVDLLADAYAVDTAALRAELEDAVRTRMQCQLALYAALDQLAELTRSNRNLQRSLRQATAELRRLHHEGRRAA